MEGSSGSDPAAGTLWLDLTQPLLPGGLLGRAVHSHRYPPGPGRNTLSGSWTLVYDTVPPALATSQPEADAVLTSALSEARFTLQDSASGVDPTQTQIVLIGPNGEAVPIQRSQEGETIVVRFAALSLSGAYRFELTVRDRAGNQPSSPILVPFTLELRGLAVAELGIGEGSFATHTNALSSIRVRLSDPSGIGVRLGEGGTQVQVSGRVVRWPDRSPRTLQTRSC